MGRLGLKTFTCSKEYGFEAISIWPFNPKAMHNKT